MHHAQHNYMEAINSKIFAGFSLDSQLHSIALHYNCFFSRLLSRNATVKSGWSLQAL